MPAPRPFVILFLLPAGIGCWVDWEHRCQRRLHQAVSSVGPPPSPAGRGGIIGRARRRGSVRVGEAQANRLPLPRRERVGVRVNGFHLPTRLQQTEIRPTRPSAHDLSHNQRQFPLCHPIFPPNPHLHDPNPPTHAPYPYPYDPNPHPHDPNAPAHTQNPLPQLPNASTHHLNACTHEKNLPPHDPYPSAHDLHACPHPPNSPTHDPNPRPHPPQPHSHRPDGRPAEKNPHPHP